MENDSSITVQMEWNVDMDSMSRTSFQMGDGPVREFGIKARCQKCWGSVLGRTNSVNAWTGIKCRVCGTVLEGEKAAEEQSRILRELTNNSMNLYFGLEPRYLEGLFVLKIFPHLPRISEEDFCERLDNSEVKFKARERMLTREDFPIGSAGMLFQQAKLLMNGVSRMSGPEESVVNFSRVRFEDDGTAVFNIPLEGMKDDPRHFENKLLGNMGSIMVQSLISAFACELAMKAISITCKDEAHKTHDLKQLFEALPQESQKRIKSDFAHIEDSLSQYRQTFDKWRYFEIAAGENALKAMIDTDRSQKLARAARVILDEASVVGLSGSVDVDATYEERFRGQKSIKNVDIHVSIIGGESPPAES